ncbi:MAG TPA: molybdopterin cofactor-binding domain-containing protein [Caulobacteraceae bacterium]|jgi:CO/xanthine dehydrogenase Mo-binding subunit
MNAPLASRRGVLAGGGIIVAFALTRGAFGQGGGQGGAGGGSAKVAANLPGDLAKFPFLDSWIAVDGAGRVTVFTGKAELGQGIKTAFVQLAAEEMDVAPGAITLITADTARTPEEGITAGSHSMQDSGTAILNAAANVRLLLAGAAAKAWSLPADRVKTKDGAAHAPDGRRLSYGQLASALSLHVAAQPNVPLKAAADFRLIGRDWPRVDIPAKLAGGAAYVQDLRLPGMLHARVVRGPSYRTRLKPADLATIARAPGVVKIVRQGAFTAIIASEEWAAVKALRQMQAPGWLRSGPPLPGGDLHAALRALPSKPIPVFDFPGPAAPLGARTLSARFTRPYLMHGSIGPSCAVALWQAGAVTVWTHSQGVGPLKKSLTELLALTPDKVRCIHVEGAGCYGHNGADDAAADAALAARAVPGRPVRLQWMREQEHGWEPLGPAMTVDLQASLDASGKIAAWRYEAWSNEHSSRPYSAGGLLAGLEVAPAFKPQTPRPIPMPEGGASRNSNPLYAFHNATGTYHFIEEAPIRVSALRSLGAHMNILAMESFMDELALAAGTDPVAFRLAHLKDDRARAVITAAAQRFGWSARLRGGGGTGCGFAFARYKNLAAYCAVAMEAEVEHETGRIQVRRVSAAVDSGEAVNPDGIRNQIEGAIVQALSWTTQEETKFDALHRTSFDWSAYPIIRFEDVPDRVEVEVINRPGQPFLGTGEAGQGPAGAAIANAIADATGKRLRDMPLSPERVKAAMGV